MYALMIWTVVAIAGDYRSQHEARDWRQLTEVQTLAMCKDAATHLAIKPEKYRCVKIKE